MKKDTSHRLKALGILLLGLALAAGGIAIGEADDAPGAGLLGLGLLVLAVLLAWRQLRRTRR